jgi:hypothetical protein
MNIDTTTNKEPSLPCGDIQEVDKIMETLV